MDRKTAQQLALATTFALATLAVTSAAGAGAGNGPAALAADARAAPQDGGTFTGEYANGLPVYRLPAVTVTETRAAALARFAREDALAAAQPVAADMVPASLDFDPLSLAGESVAESEVARRLEIGAFGLFALVVLSLVVARGATGRPREPVRVRREFGPAPLPTARAAAPVPAVAATPTPGMARPVVPAMAAARIATPAVVSLTEVRVQAYRARRRPVTVRTDAA